MSASDSSFRDAGSRQVNDLHHENSLRAHPLLLIFVFLRQRYSAVYSCIRANRRTRSSFCRVLPREWILPVIALLKQTCELLTVNSCGENRDESARGDFLFASRLRDTRKTNTRKGKNQLHGNRTFIQSAGKSSVFFSHFCQIFKNIFPRLQYISFLLKEVLSVTMLLRAMGVL